MGVNPTITTRFILRLLNLGMNLCKSVYMLDFLQDFIQCILQVKPEELGKTDVLLFPIIHRGVSLILIQIAKIRIIQDRYYTAKEILKKLNIQEERGVSM